MDLRERSGASQRHPWEVARAGFFRSLVGAMRLPPGARVLDIGAGDGWLAMQLREGALLSPEILCWDINYTEDDLVDEPVRQGLIARSRKEPTGQFDLILLLDVLEHIEDDEAFLCDQVLTHLAPGGRLVISVPVHPILFTSHDTMLRHVRRYRVKEIRALLGRRTVILEQGSLFTSLLPPRAAEKVLEAVRPRQPHGIGAWTGGRLLTRCITTALEVDGRGNRWLARRHVPSAGLSYWAVVEGPPNG